MCIRDRYHQEDEHAERQEVCVAQRQRGGAGEVPAVGQGAVEQPSEQPEARIAAGGQAEASFCLLYTSPSPRDRTRSRMPSSA